MMSACGECGLWGGCVCFDPGEQGGGVGAGRAAGGGGKLVAGGFAFVAHLTADPPDGGAEEEKCFDDHLGEIYQVVVAAEVGDLVGEDGAQGHLIAAGDHGGGKEDRGAEEARHRRGAEVCTLQEHDRAQASEFGLDGGEKVLDKGGCDRLGGAPEFSEGVVTTGCA